MFEDTTMSSTMIIPREHAYLLLSCSLCLSLIFVGQFFAGLCNLIVHCYSRRISSGGRRIRRFRSIFNLYLFHHLIICLIRCLIISFACLSIILTGQCLAIEFPLHFLLLLSTFDLLLIVIGETVHFWDSAINRQSTLHSKCCLIFGMLFNYFVSSLFLSIHLTMTGDNPIVMELCRTTRKRFFLTPTTNDERSIIPTLITYVLFILLDFLTFSWISISYRDIFHLKQKRLATLFFHSLVFTKFKEQERMAMVNRSLQRLRILSLSVLSNSIVILPVLTMKIFQISLTQKQRLTLIYLTMLPWLDAITFVFYHETQFHCCRCCSKRLSSKNDFYRRQRVGRRLSAYRDHKRDLPTISETSTN